jgi:hypothetical protein
MNTDVQTSDPQDSKRRLCLPRELGPLAGLGWCFGISEICSVRPSASVLREETWQVTGTPDMAVNTRQQENKGSPVYYEIGYELY